MHFNANIDFPLEWSPSSLHTKPLHVFTSDMGIDNVIEMKQSPLVYSLYSSVIPGPVFVFFHTLLPSIIHQCLVFPHQS